MYRELKRKDFIKDLEISEKDIPEAVIIYGGYKIPDFVRSWVEVNCHYQRPLFYTLYIGKHSEKNIAFIMAYGDSMASEITHIFSKIGAKLIVLYGTFGALQKGINFGEIFIPSEAISDDGASIKYNPKNNKLLPTASLVKILKNLVKEKGINLREGTIVSTSAMLAETKEIIGQWNKDGYVGVDLETAAVFATANYFGVPTIAFHTLADNLIENQTVLDVKFNQQHNYNKKRETKNLMFKLALDLCEEFLTT